MAYTFEQRELPDWFDILAASCFSLGALSGAICLGMAFIDRVRRRRQSTPSRGEGELQHGAA